MKTCYTFLLLLGIFGGYSSAMAQEEKPKQFDLSFADKDTTLLLLSGMDNNFLFSFQSSVFNKKNNYTVAIVADEMKSDILKKDYKIFFAPKKLGELSDEEQTQFFVKISKEAQMGTGKKLVLKFSVTDSTGNAVGNGSSVTPEMIINIPSGSRLNGYNYLAYIGTNFDLVDGIKAKHLFFAVNIFLPPATTYRIPVPRSGKAIQKEYGKLTREKNPLRIDQLDTVWGTKDAVKSVGIYFSLYGNRTFSATDSLRDVYRLSGVSFDNYDTVTRYYERMTVARKRVSDNIGASFMPLFRCGTASDQKNTIRLYCGPSFDFIWRRIQMDFSYVDRTPTDTIYEPVATAPPFSANYVAPNQLKSNYNEFDVNIGGALFITHETDKISMRVSVSSGIQLHYTPESLYTGSADPSETTYRTELNAYFCGRAWITDQSSGITLQAEITNTIANSKPYYGVTLSKAINYEKLGELFSPLTSR